MGKTLIPPMPDDDWLPSHISLVDRPFACPPDIPPIVLDLPIPPSVNRMYRVSAKQNVYRSEPYTKWLKRADMTVLVLRQYPRQRITGPFQVDILLNNNHRGDGDNRIKAVLDYLQSRDITPDDKHCRGGLWAWVAPSLAPEGCRVTVRQAT